jgi:prepilin-type N-terminal cleavage/methylation domain-containing protein
MKKNLKKKGFTLIELIVVIAILAILALILVPSITGYIASATNAKNQANARSEYSRVMLEVTTTGALTNGGAAVTSGTAYTVAGLSCNATYANSIVSAFACNLSGKYWSQNNGFSGGATQ